MSPHVDPGEDRPDLPHTPHLPPDLGMFADSGVQFSNPGTGPLGPVEHMLGLARNGYGYASFEVFDGGGTKDWRIWHTEAEKNFLPQRPWARCRNTADVEKLCAIARLWGQAPIVNLEEEATSSLPPDLCADVVGDKWGGEFAVQCLAILYDSVDWTPLDDAGAVCILEAYANEIPRFSDWAFLIKRAHACFEKVILSPGYYEFPPDTGTYPKRSLYASFPAPWLIYLGDNVHNWAEWRSPA